MGLVRGIENGRFVYCTIGACSIIINQSCGSKTHLSAVGGVIQTAISCIACGNKLRQSVGALHIHLTMSKGINPQWGQNIKNYVLQGVLTPWEILSESTVLPHQSD